MNSTKAVVIILFVLNAVFLERAFSQDSAGAVMPLEFDSEQHRERYQHFSKILRCPMCQNQNLSGSDAGIAADLRKTLHRLIGDNKTDQEIIDFMQSRYGNFILYEPPVNKATFVLWFGPALLLLAGLVVVRRLTSRGGSGGDSVQPSGLSDEDLQRARRLLEDEQEGRGASGS